METKRNIFSMIEPSDNLKSSILNKIKIEERKRTIFKIVFSSVVSLASVSMAAVYIINIVKDFYQSGLSEYVSLLFSDGVSMASYWQSYVMSIVESLPIVPITIAVASIGVFVWSVNMALTSLKNTRSVFYKVN
jgi:hypothetical protein